MTRVIALALAALLAGCAPSLIASSPGTVIVDHYDDFSTQATINLATAECRKYGGTAVLRSTAVGWAYRHVFECRA